VIALYALALVVSAALLFLLEPMVGKFVLPLLGSAPPRPPRSPNWVAAPISVPNCSAKDHK
jgi:hypothetical protein